MKKQKILLVDDEELIRLTYEIFLNKEGFDVEIAESAQQAIDKLESDSFYNLVITDLRMNGLSGVDVFKKAIEINGNIPVIIVSGFSNESPEFKEAMRLKPFGYAFKPFPMKELLDMIRAGLDL